MLVERCSDPERPGAASPYAIPTSTPLLGKGNKASCANRLSIAAFFDPILINAIPSQRLASFRCCPIFPRMEPGAGRVARYRSVRRGALAGPRFAGAGRSRPRLAPSRPLGRTASQYWLRPSRSPLLGSEEVRLGNVAGPRLRLLAFLVLA